ncbi:TIR domain-containing protein [Brevundimonas pishanensis]|uniref:TIR domain-containing protein n=1 Tax=Brevundimonas pishanensis TaxID=2896315 RepID=UPI001FA71329|nr:TIR domain-containing protein [Brevundimonas pishanensis]
MDMQNEPLIFVSYASPDRERVMPFYSALKQRGLNAWIDKERLLGGQNWDFEIRKALNSASLIVMFISHNSITRRGYVQREIKLALHKLEEKLVDDIYIIPVMLDVDARRPDQLEGLQFLDASDPDFVNHLCEAISHQAIEAETATAAWTHEHDLSWTKVAIKEEWSGLPGYQFSSEVVHLVSGKYQNLSDCADIIKGWIKSSLLEQRLSILDQSSEFYNFGMTRELRSHIWDAFASDPVFAGRCVSIKYSVSWYNAGAAHSIFGFHTFNFLLDPCCELGRLERWFSEEETVLSIIQATVKEELLKLRWDDDEEDTPLLMEDDIVNGTSSWSDFSNYSLGEEAIEFFFGAYQVGPYAVGPQSAQVPYSKVAKYMNDTLRSALNITYTDGPEPPWLSEEPSADDATSNDQG